VQQAHSFAAIGAAEYIFNSLSLLINRTKVKLRYFNAPTDSNTFSVGCNVKQPQTNSRLNLL
jgi:hypothetical protein